MNFESFTERALANGEQILLFVRNPANKSDFNMFQSVTHLELPDMFAAAMAHMAKNLSKWSEGKVTPEEVLLATLTHCENAALKIIRGENFIPPDGLDNSRLYSREPKDVPKNQE
jgi:hypothetical protein